MYKLSAYNYMVPFGERMIYFNGISNQIFSLSITEHHKIEKCLSDLISFEINYTSVFKQFKKWGFIVQENCDEIDILRFRHHKAVFDNRTYHLFVNPTLECNFNCWYCYEEHPQGCMSNDIIERIKKHILYMIEKEQISLFHLSWFGGEPLIYFNEVVYPISLYAKNICLQHGIKFHNSITTNASKITEDMVKEMRKINLASFQITIDGDQKRHDLIRNENGVPSFNLIKNNILLLCQNILDVNITLRINYDNKTLLSNDLRGVLESFPMEYRKNISVDFQRVWQTIKEGKGENLERIDLYNECCELGYSQVGVGANVFSMGKCYKCYADRFNHAEINYDGKIYRCTARGYSDKYVVGEMDENGIIKWNMYEIARRFGKAPFENEMCLKCKYLPLCLGPCSQKIIESKAAELSHLCALNDSDITPNTIIIDYYKKKMKLQREGKY